MPEEAGGAAELGRTDDGATEEGVLLAGPDVDETVPDDGLTDEDGALEDVRLCVDTKNGRRDRP